MSSDRRRRNRVLISGLAGCLVATGLILLASSSARAVTTCTVHTVTDLAADLSTGSTCTTVVLAPGSSPLVYDESMPANTPLVVPDGANPLTLDLDAQTLTIQNVFDPAAGIEVPSSTSLVIADSNDTNHTGTLMVTGGVAISGSDGGGAGIGGNSSTGSGTGTGETSGPVTITGGTVIATGGFGEGGGGAGIGGGGGANTGTIGDGGAGGTLTVTGGTLTVTGGTGGPAGGGAGIGGGGAGGGRGGNGGTVSFTGGTLTSATGGSGGGAGAGGGAGIGGGGQGIGTSSTPGTGGTLTVATPATVNAGTAGGPTGAGGAEATTTDFALTAAPNPAPVGTPVTLTEAVTSVGAFCNSTGTVTFFDDGVVVPGTVTLPSTPPGNADTLIYGLTTSLAAGTHPITVSFTPVTPGCAALAADPTNATEVVVGTAPLITSAAAASFSYGTVGSYTITTTGPPAPAISETGTLPAGVTLTDNGDGTATLTDTAATPAGSYPFTITATDGIAPAATQNFTLTVNKAATTTTITTLTPTPASVGAGFTVSVTVAAVPPAASMPPSGTVTITDSATGASCDAGHLDFEGHVFCALTETTAGNHTVTATYSGDSNYTGSTGTAAQLVNKAATTTTITTAPAQVTDGQSFTVNVTATGPGGPTGTVTISDGSQSCTATLTGGSGSCTLVATTTGPQIITAAYNGDANNLGSSTTASANAIGAPRPVYCDRHTGPHHHPEPMLCPNGN